MLREDKSARWESEPGILFRRRYRLRAGAIRGRVLSASALRSLNGRQQIAPIELVDTARGRCWWYRDRFYWADDDLEAGDVLALVTERERHRDRRLQRARDQLVRELPASGRRPLAREVKLAVWRRDGGTCTRCGAGELLQFDHVIPLALGGSSAPANLQLLCDRCNAEKGPALD